MAVGFPTKANWAAGDVLTASALDDLAGTVNYTQYMKPWNAVLNSNMSVWQRGTSFTASGPAYAADRWDYSTFGGGVNQTISRVATGDATNLPNIQYALRYQRNNTTTGTGAYQLTQSFETVNSIPFAGKSVTLSFYARCGTTSNGFSSLVAQVRTGTGTDENTLNGYTGNATPINNTATLTTTWQRFTYTGTIASSATEIALYFSVNPSGTAGTTDYFDITGVQLEQGSVANTYQPNATTFQGELDSCKRYRRQSYDVGVAAGTAAASNGINFVYETSVANNSTFANVSLGEGMRTAPTVTVYGYNGTVNTVSLVSTGADQPSASGTANNIGQTNFTIKNYYAGTITSTQGFIFHWTADAEL